MQDDVMFGFCFICLFVTDWVVGIVEDCVGAKTMSQCQSVEVVAFSKTGQVARSKTGQVALSKAG